MGIEGIATLTDLSLGYCDKVSFVATLAASTSLRKLNIGGTRVTDAGLSGIERIPTLEELSLSHCMSVSSVANFVTSKSLKKLNLTWTRVPAAELQLLASQGVTVEF